jgi:hypothetical protein
MAWVHAWRVPAEMIDVKARWDRADRQFIGNAMRPHLCESSIAVSVTVSGPDPATRWLLIDLRPEPVAERFWVAYHGNLSST